jgi:hypothetical protein
MQNFLKISWGNQRAKKVQIYWECDQMAVKKSNFACVYRQNISQYDSVEQCGPSVSCLSVAA